MAALRLLGSFLIQVIALTCFLKDCEGASEGTHFLLAFPSDIYDLTPEVRVTAREETDVQLRGDNIDDSYTVGAGESAILTMSAEDRVSIGVEDKGFELTSDLPVFVTVGTQDHTSPRTTDEVSGRAMNANDVDFYVISYLGDHTSSSGPPLSFFTIVASNDGTEVNITDPSTGDSTTIILDQYQTYTEDAEYHQQGKDMDYSGVHITSSNPISVVAGHGRVNTGDDNQYVCDSMFSLSHAGYLYTTFPVLLGPDDNGYVVRVVATKDVTSVYVPDQSAVFLNEGEFVDIQHGDSDTAFEIACSEPCMALQVTKAINEYGGQPNSRMSSAMVPLVTNDLYSQDLYFTTPYMDVEDETVHAKLAIVVNSSSVSNLFLDDESIDDLSWEMATGSGFSYASMNVDADTVYHLYTTEPGQGFTGYIYTSYSYIVSKGYTIGFDDNDIEDVFPDDRAAPMYEMILLGDFTSGDNGGDYTPQCSSEYSNSFNTQALAQVSTVNSEIGTTLCTKYQEREIWLSSVSTTFTADGPSGNTRAVFVMSSVNYIIMADIYDCADEVSAYLQDFTNWGTPVIPPVEDCPPVIFDPQYFYENDQKWVCPSTYNTEGLSLAGDHPDYSLRVHDLYSTFDDEPLEGDCIVAYGDSWAATVASMTSDLNSMMADGTLCPGAENSITISSSSQFTTLTNTGGELAATFIMSVHTADVRFTDVTGCADRVFVEVQNHSSWTNGPLLPQEGNCPRLTYGEEATFKKYEEKWLCP